MPAGIFETVTAAERKLKKNVGSRTQQTQELNIKRKIRSKRSNLKCCQLVDN